ncbi:hypothetical protein B0S90_0447 [Caldicellulosiruptor bescii]|uniref:Uncharacterized protein n=2 Tax=Caldicellulosiruptor bescii TaxID=31899 RepID=B9MM98_CALBD|nr:DUF5696 domain-containing protein [Caldicellulosiruptor bescii]ACM59330.1 conserved hypothetical protein [Caldicellulosiruptor bescii DSM 6725]PBC88213.1 hypothetical protein B0S87_1178 [Caldicellulosiruptor bescii]PBC92306.1 hypothetical protein B0S89_2815 [Caldicellulosiruptor bescii]PBD04883.1 hypothetical protein B0S85_2593 [Caldicellulosiruptor bescii]PBD05487.1 hypothetical protein B0S90_0447 [Caldicellulosiruptor bescii]
MFDLKKYKLIRTIGIIFAIIITQILSFQKIYADSEISFQKIAANDRLELYVNKKYGYFKVLDKKTNIVWLSNPENWKEDTVAAGSMKTQLASQLVVKYAFMESYAIQTSNSYVSSAMKRGLKIKPIKNGYIATYSFKKEGFVIPVAVTISNDYLNIEVLVNQIKELKKEKYRLVSIMLLPFFGAASKSDKGYIVVPDGCGAVINFNNKKGEEEYSQRVYGPDYALIREPNTYVTQYARLPVFGMNKNDSGFLAVVTNGDSKAIINAYTSGVRTNFNQVFSEFIIREQDSVTFREKQWNEKTFNIFEENIPNQTKYSIRYYFLDKNKSDYIAMAEKYREYLIKEKGLKKEDQQKLPLYIELYGGMKKTKYIVGLPRNVTIPLTTFDDAIEISKRLKNIGIKDIVVKYTGWYENGVYYNLPISPKPEKVLGGWKGFRKMIDYFNRNNIKAYFDVDFVTFRKGSLFYPLNVVATKSLRKMPAKLIRYSPATCYADDDYPLLFMVSPSYVTKFVDKFIGSKHAEIKNISISTISKMLYSDFGSKQINRLKTEEIFTNLVEKVTKQYNVLLTSPNGYLIPKGKEIIDVPISSSKFAIEDYEIPFYQMVLRGYIPYSTPAINDYTNDWMVLLKTLETGSFLKFTWTARNEDELKETMCDFLYSSNYRMWLNDVKSMYRKIYPVLQQINNKKFLEHKVLKEGLVYVKFDGGVEILLNYTSSDQKVGNTVVKARDFKVIKR